MTAEPLDLTQSAEELHARLRRQFGGVVDGVILTDDFVEVLLLDSSAYGVDYAQAVSRQVANHLAATPKLEQPEFTRIDDRAMTVVARRKR